MSITGLGALGFLVVHLGGNLFIYSGRDAFDAYAHHLHSIPSLILLAFRAGLLALFLIHVTFGVMITLRNWRSRRTPYSMRKSAGGGNVASSTMIYSGILVLIFIAMHLLTVKSNSANLEAYDRVVAVLSNPLGAASYILGVLALGFHLFHGAGSTLQSLGINHPRYSTFITWAGRTVAVIFAVCFTSIPVYAWFVLGKGWTH
jgi:succinate dehydrogenase / fumarate reductase cytochrome b subunit